MLLVGHPADRGRLRPVAERRGQVVGPTSADGPGQQLVVAARRRRPRLPGQHPPDHVADEDLLVGLGHPLRDQHHDRVAFPVGRHGPLPTGAAPHLDRARRPTRDGTSWRCGLHRQRLLLRAPAQRTPAEHWISARRMTTRHDRFPQRVERRPSAARIGTVAPQADAHRCTPFHTVVHNQWTAAARPAIDSATRRRLAFRARNLQMVGHARRGRQAAAEAAGGFVLPRRGRAAETAHLA